MADAARLARTRCVLLADPAGVLRARYQPAGVAVETPVPEFSEYVFAVDERDVPVDASVGLPGSWPTWDSGFPDLGVTVAGEVARRLTWRGEQDVVFVSIAAQDAPLAQVAPRQVLGTAVARLRAAGLTARIGFELEFALRGSTATPARSAYGVALSTAERRFFDALLPALTAAGIGVDSWCREGGNDQWEVALSAADPIAAADSAVLARLAIVEIALEQALQADFDPRPAAGFGSGLHAHVSFADATGRNVLHLDADGTPTDAAGAGALAGLLLLLPDATALLSPSTAGFERFTPHSAAGTTATWASETRSVGVRHLTRGVDTRLELRVASSDADPFLLTAVLLMGSAVGVERRAQLPPSTRGDAYLTAGPVLTLPTTLLEAADRLTRSADLRDAFGDTFVDHYGTLARWRATRA